ncbi:4-hydroxy-tetrahydrodipicolinate synthase [Alicyclobacillus sp. SO9]|uniref:4-hydroxy-tetrahydrodipicolinate synthase n=1 Tax=Alicyclobacillus sp. SO9 TaxID=2665646 RepID=UPI0018E78FAD|nr:4-hydroxy-tetrahydrodipicolinate synthase [Alicyclobacillus sp. SO9]QQE80860.1 4-hydroxy-tetrahydrodipicolinate synthase [Alicyclobacillus sp. SO9]
MDYGRLVTAMVTPFTESGELDELGIRRIVNHLLETGTTAIVAAGTTGESPTLTHSEKLRLFQLTVEAVNKRVPVIAGTGSNDTKSAVELSQEAAAVGVDGLLQVSPYYNKPSQEGLYQHFKTVAEAVNLPIMLYNIPGRCGVNIDVDTVLRLAQIPNITSIKEASGNFSYIAELAAKKSDDFLMYSGDDKFTLPIMSLGGYGVVSVAAHVVGQEMTAMIDAFLTGDTAEAAVWNGRLMPMFTTLFKTSNPSPLKAALRMMNVDAGPLRLPLVEAPVEVQNLLKEELERLGKMQLPV